MRSQTRRSSGAGLVRSAPETALMGSSRAVTRKAGVGGKIVDLGRLDDRLVRTLPVPTPASTTSTVTTQCEASRMASAQYPLCTPRYSGVIPACILMTVVLVAASVSPDKMRVPLSSTADASARSGAIASGELIEDP